MTNVPRTKAVLSALTVFLALAVVFAGVFVCSVLDHDCIGEYCPVCPQVEAARRLVESLCRAAALALAAAFAAVCVAGPVKHYALPYVFQLTPVSLQIKSNT